MTISVCSITGTCCTMILGTLMQFAVYYAPIVSEGKFLKLLYLYIKKLVFNFFYGFNLHFS